MVPFEPERFQYQEPSPLPDEAVEIFGIVTAGIFNTGTVGGTGIAIIVGSNPFGVAGGLTTTFFSVGTLGIVIAGAVISILSIASVGTIEIFIPLESNGMLITGAVVAEITGIAGVSDFGNAPRFMTGADTFTEIFELIGEN